MADDKEQYNDEYQFSDLDAISPDYAETPAEEEGTRSSPASDASSKVLRNALIAVGVFVLAMVLYEFVGNWLGGGKKPPQPDKTATPQAPQIPPIKEATQQTKVEPEAPPEPTVSTNVEDNLKKRIGALEIGQQNLRSEMNEVKDEMNSLNSNVNEISEQLTRLNQAITQLSSQLEEQSTKINNLRVRIKRKAVQRPKVVKRVYKKPVIYYIQAVIPGRAWLIASNGSTITVSEGSKVRGYGVVKLIDPIQGKVLTSSGKTIRFSPKES